MPSFQDSIFLFILALLLFGPKKLPVLARELGKWIGEFRRASNEFKMQMEEELRMAEQVDRQKQIAAMEAAAPVMPALPAESSAEPEQQILHSVQDDKLTVEPPPIAVSGDLKIMPPATGLPQARGEGASHHGNDSRALDGLLESIPVAAEEHAAEEGAAHGD
jgi:sec-independent protein translocase protein TatB